MATFQQRIHNWCIECFGKDQAINLDERMARFFEEATELVQAAGLPEEYCYQLVRYTYSKPVGDIEDEVGGTMVGLAALCTALDVEMSSCANKQLHKCWANIDKIRAKHKAKPRNSPLPGGATFPPLPNCHLGKPKPTWKRFLPWLKK